MQHVDLQSNFVTVQVSSREITRTRGYQAGVARYRLTPNGEVLIFQDDSPSRSPESENARSAKRASTGQLPVPIVCLSGHYLRPL